jgi:hypothetical protein
MRKLVLAALVATLGLAQAAEPPAAAAEGGAGTKPDAKAQEHPAKSKGSKPRAKAPKAQAGKDAAPAKAQETGKAKAEAEKPCEPVKPCPID